MTIAFIAIVVALLLGLAVSRAAFRPKHSVNLEALRREIDRAEQRHAPRAGLRKQLVEAVRRELEKTS